MSADQLVKVGVIVGPHGIKGDIKIKSFAENPENFKKYKPAFKGEQDPIKFKVKTVKNDVLIVTMENVNDRTAAEKLRGKELFTKRENLPELKGNEFYQIDLVGLEVKNSDGTTYGKVDGIYNFGAGDIIEITCCKDRKAKMFPFTKTVVTEVNTDKGFITINPPEEV